MTGNKSKIYAAIAGLVMLVIILDGKTATYGASQGIEVCLRTVVPSVFPFFILSSFIYTSLIGQDIRLLRPLGRLCKIPAGSESIMLLGYVAGYPVGAQLIGQCYKDGRISLETAKRMVCFCNNSGPAFIFGMVATRFSGLYIVWVLWLIHLLSGLMVGLILPDCGSPAFRSVSAEPVCVKNALDRSVRIILSVCSWVIVFRIVLEFCGRWFMWRLPVTMQVLISGLLELSNGCIRLNEIQCEGLRFIVASILLSAGGLCVTMQTLSVSQGTVGPKYFLGKGTQTVFSLLLCVTLQPILFSKSNQFHFPTALIFVLCCIALALIFLAQKKDIAFSRKIVYNEGNTVR